MSLRVSGAFSSQCPVLFSPSPARCGVSRLSVAFENKHFIGWTTWILLTPNPFTKVFSSLKFYFLTFQERAWVTLDTWVWPQRHPGSVPAQIPGWTFVFCLLTSPLWNDLYPTLPAQTLLILLIPPSSWKYAFQYHNFFFFFFSVFLSSAHLGCGIWTGHVKVLTQILSTWEGQFPLWHSGSQSD